MYEETMDTPLGRVRVAATDRGICVMELLKGPSGGGRAKPRGNENAPSADSPARRHVAQAIVQVREYFCGKRREFDLPLDLHGTEQQLRVWKMLLAIPYGRTQTYGELARRLGNVRAARAVGGACGSNPVWLVVPCHRVVGQNGSLTGYGGGIERKRALLEHESGQQRLAAV